MKLLIVRFSDFKEIGDWLFLPIIKCIWGETDYDIVQIEDYMTYIKLLIVLN